MKKVVYILASTLAIAAFILFLVEVIPEFKEMDESTNDFLLLYSIVNYCLYSGSILALGVLSVLQLKKSTPKLLLIFSGNAVFNSILFIFYGSVSGYFVMAAGLLPASYELIFNGMIVKQLPKYKDNFGSLLTGAGILTCVGIIISIITSIPYYLKNDFLPPYFYYSYAGGIICSICLVVFCFLKNRRTSVLYRMFFVGPSIIGALYIPVIIVSYVVYRAIIEPLSVIGNLISVTVILLILIHTFKTRHESVIPQEHTDIIPQEEIPVSQT